MKRTTDAKNVLRFVERMEALAEATNYYANVCVASAEDQAPAIKLALQERAIVFREISLSIIQAMNGETPELLKPDQARGYEQMDRDATGSTDS